MTALSLRIEVADLPGTLAGITTALAALGVDVATLDVLEVDGRSAVDELVVRAPKGITAQDVRDVLRMAGAHVLSCAPSSGVIDPTVAAFDLTRQALEAPGDADAPHRALAQVAGADVAVLVPTSEALQYPLARRALDLRVPASGPAGPDASPLPVGGQVIWVAPEVAAPICLAVAGRRLDIRFAATEASRLRALSSLLEQLRRAQAWA